MTRRRSTITMVRCGARRLPKRLALLVALVANPAFAQNDLSVTAIASPASGCALTATENVTVRLFNYGSTLPAATMFNATYAVNAGAPVMELIVLPASLLQNSSFTYTFTTQANLAAPGTYTFDASVSLPGDVNPANDAFSGYAVTNSAPSVGGTIGAVAPASSGTLALTGQTGSVEQWEESEDGGLRWFVLSNPSPTLSFANLRGTTQFRARVRNGACAEAVSTVTTVTP